jgi:hypothetical protein
VASRSLLGSGVGPGGAGSGGAGPGGAGPGGGLADALERLAALRAGGHLTEAEFAAAKARVLRESSDEGR